MSPERPDGRSGTYGSAPALSRGFLCLAVGLTLGLALVLFAPAYTEWREFLWPDSMGLDLALFNQSFYLALRDGWFHSTLGQSLIYHGVLMGNHFAPNFYLFLPVYAVWQSPLLLLFLASLAVAVGGLGILLAARRILRSAAIALIWFGLFALHPFVPYAVFENGWREVFVASGFLSFALYYYLRGNDSLFWLTVGLAVLSKEDVALVLPVWGIVAWFQRRGWRLAGSMVLLGVTYFLVVNAIVMPLLRGTPIGHTFFLGFTSPAGQNLNDIFHSIWLMPSEIVQRALSRQDLEFWARVFSPLLFLPLLGGEYLVIPAYVYLEVSLSDPRLQQFPLSHVFPAFPFIFVAAMVGTVRLVRVVEKISPLRTAAVRSVSLGALLCALVGSAVYNTTFPALRDYWPTEASLKRDVPLLQALTRIPPRASLAATDTLIAEGSSRALLYSGDDPVYKPDYIAINPEDPGMDQPQARRRIASVLCGGVYGVTLYNVLVRADQTMATHIFLARGADLSANRRVYEALFPGSRPGRIVLERSADLSANRAVYERYLPGPHQPCPVPGHEAITPGMFRRAASIHIRTRVPSEVLPDEMFLEPVRVLSGTRFAQVIHLPDHTFAPGSYQVDLVGAWPWPGTSAGFEVTARVRVGERTVGEVTARGDQLLRYTTFPFRVDRQETLPVRVEADVRIPAERKVEAWALWPRGGGCAVVADAPSLNPQRVTVQALFYLEGVPPGGRGEVELPILSKNAASGYYLRLAGDAQGKLWVDFNVAGKWGLGQAGVGMVPIRRWTAVAATYDGEEAKIYLDGHQVPQEASRSARYAGAMRSAEAPLVVGCRDPHSSPAVRFPGLIASARVWDRVLTPQEIQEEVPWALPAGGVRGVVGSWGFQAVDGGVIPDQSGLGNVITNGRALTRVRVAGIKPPFAAWRARELNVLRQVTVRGVPSAEVRQQFPSELGPEAMFPELGEGRSSTVFAEVIHLPDHRFAPGWYRVDLVGAWPLPWVSASYQMRARVRVGERVVGEVTAGGAQPLRYATPPFRVDRQETLPVRVEVDVRIPAGRGGEAWALRPRRGGCAVVADAPGLNPRQVTVEALLYLDKIPPHPARELELPILSKNNERGYYLRLVSDAQGQLWVDFNVAGKWALGRAGVGAMPAHRWTAVAATYDGREVKVYLDGYQAPQEASRNPRYAGAIRSEGAPLVIGCRDAGQPSEVVFPGLIASARVWDRVLTVQEIREAETAWPLPGGAAQGLVGIWGFQAAGVGVVPDQSGLGHPVTNGRRLTRVLMPGSPHPFAAWRAGDLNVLRTVTVRSVKP